MIIKHIARAILIVTIGTVVASCGGAGDSGHGASPGPTEPPPATPSRTVARIQISPRVDSANHMEGDTLRLTVVALDSIGNTLPLPAVPSWTAMDTSVTVSQTGTVTMLASGAGRVAAYSGQYADTISLAPKVTPKLALHISPRSDAMPHAAGDTLRLRAAVIDLFRQKDVTASTVVAWASLDTAVATVIATGDVIARGSGTARIVARVGAVADTVVLTLHVTLPTVRIVSINGAPISTTGPTAVADSLRTGIEIRNPADGYPVNNILVAVATPISPTYATTPFLPDVQPGETRIVVIRDPYAPRGQYSVHPEVLAGGYPVHGAAITLVVSNRDSTPPSITLTAPAHDTTWTVGTPLRLKFNVLDTGSGVQGYFFKTTWAAPQPAGCLDNPVGTVDLNSGFTSIPAVADFTGCSVPVGLNTIIITAYDRAGNTTSTTLWITGK